MTVFILVAGVVLAAALFWVARPLLRARAQNAPAHDAANLAVLRDQLAEMDADRAAGLLSEEDHARTRAELERRVLEEVRTTQPPADAPFAAGRLAIAIVLLIGVCSIALYTALGEPQSIGVQREQARAAHEIDDMIEQLARRMEQQPQDAKGWAILARSYYALGRYAESARAYERLVPLIPADADVLADYADALGMAQGGDLRGPPLQLLLRASKIDPKHAKTRLLLGGEAQAREDYRTALKYWEPLLAELPPEAELTQRLRAAVDELRAQTGAPPSVKAPAVPAPAAATLSGTVTLAPALAASVGAGDTLFVFARAAEGSRIPLAVLRLKAGQLPATFELSDANAMRPDALLSKQKSVIVGARISKSGNPMPQSGDLEGFSAATAPGAKDLRIVIDRRVP